MSDEQLEDTVVTRDEQPKYLWIGYMKDAADKQQRGKYHRWEMGDCKPEDI